MFVTHRGVLAPIRGQDFDFITQSANWAGGFFNQTVETTMITLDLGSQLQDRLILLRWHLNCSDQNSEGPHFFTGNVRDIGTAALSSLSGALLFGFWQERIPLAAFTTFSSFNAIRVTTAGTVIFEMRGSLLAATVTGLAFNTAQTHLGAFII